MIIRARLIFRNRPNTCAQNVRKNGRIWWNFNYYQRELITKLHQPRVKSCSLE